MSQPLYAISVSFKSHRHSLFGRFTHESCSTREEVEAAITKCHLKMLDLLVQGEAQTIYMGDPRRLACFHGCELKPEYYGNRIVLKDLIDKIQDERGGFFSVEVDVHDPSEVSTWF